MPPNRPTFSESWYRVHHMRPKLRTTVQTFRQHYRGRLWHVLRDPSNNQFFRLNDASYHFVALLNGLRTVSEAWDICNEQLGDQAPTQNEVIQLLGQLYGANLIIAEMAADSAGLFERYRKKIGREVKGYLTNFLFVRVPLWDPDVFLERWVPAAGWMFGPIGFILWALLLILAGIQMVTHTDMLAAEARLDRIVNPDNLIYMYIAMIFTKALHELGHGFACKKYGRDSHSGGEVHTVGLMFLVFVPVPYVDASSAWALRNKSQRAIIGAAGMYVELAVAATAVFVWVNTNAGSAAHQIAFNAMVIASVSTLLFNGNPLLRFDGYYILSDILEIPNLSQRSKDYVYYLVKRYVYGSTQARHPMLTAGERPWLVMFFLASTTYRIIISFGILMIVYNYIPFAGVLLASAAIIMWVVVPVSKFIHYLATSGEIMRTRTRAVLSTVIFCSTVVILIGIIPFTEHARAPGVVEPRNVQVVYATEDGFVSSILPTNSPVVGKESVMVRQRNEELHTQMVQLQREHDEINTRLRTMLTEDPAAADTLRGHLRAIDDQIAGLQRQIDALTVESLISGYWITPADDRMQDVYVRRGDRVGMVASTDDLMIRIAANQAIGPRLLKHLKVGDEVELRIHGRPEAQFKGTVQRISKSGQRNLPSAALGYLGGGEMEVSRDDEQGRRTTEAFFEIIIDPLQNKVDNMDLLSGQRVIARFDLPKAPLIAQWWRALLQLVQTNFQS